MRFTCFYPQIRGSLSEFPFNQCSDPDSHNNKMTRTWVGYVMKAQISMHNMADLRYLASKVYPASGFHSIRRLQKLRTHTFLWVRPTDCLALSRNMGTKNRGNTQKLEHPSNMWMVTLDWNLKTHIYIYILCIIYIYILYCHLNVYISAWSSVGKSSEDVFHTSIFKWSLVHLPPMWPWCLSWPSQKVASLVEMFNCY